MGESGGTRPERRQQRGHTERALGRLVRRVAMTEEEEIDCTTCLVRVPVYVDRELAGADVAAEMPELQLHLAQCGDCAEEYEALRDLAALDSSGGLPDRATLLHRLDAR